MIAFNGVRNSWLIWAKNALLARFASRALSRAVSNSAADLQSSSVRSFTRTSSRSFSSSRFWFNALNFFPFFFELPVPLADLVRHVAEGAGQFADLAPIVHRQDHIEIALSRAALSR